MKNFKKHMANEHPCLLAELENIRGEITSAGGPEWTTSTSDLQLTKSDDWKRNVLTANDFERIKNYHQIAISTTNEDTQCFRYAGDIPMFKTYESSGGMGEQSYRFCSLPVKASNGQFYTISFEMLKNINGVTCGYVVDCVSGGDKIVKLNGTGGLIADYIPSAVPTTPLSAWNNYANTIASADTIILVTGDSAANNFTNNIFKKCATDATSIYYLSALPSKFYVMQVRTTGSSGIQIYTHSINIG